MAVVGTAEYDVEITRAKVQSEVDAASKVIEQGLDKSAKKARSSLSTIAGGIALGAGLKKVIGEYEQAQKVGAQTAAVIKSTGNAAEVSAAQQDKMVQSLSDLSAIDDEIIAQGANVLRTFTNIKGADTFEGALRAATDLSAAMGTDLQGSIVQVGKALNDPIKGVSALTRVGVSFTQQQKDQIKTLVASGDAMVAQKLILAELQKEFGGAAEANATNSAKMKVAFDNAAESLGGALAPALTGAAKAAEVASKAFQAIPEPVQAAVVAGAALALVGPKVQSALEVIASSASSVKTALTGSVSSFGYLQSALAGAAAGIAAYNATYTALEQHSDFKGNVEELTKAVSGLGDGLQPVDAVFEATGKSGQQLASDLNFLYEFSGKDIGSRLVDSLKPGEEGIFRATDHAKAAKKEFAAIDSSLAELAGTNPKAAQAAIEQISTALLANGASADAVATLFPKASDAITASGTAAVTAAGQHEQLTTAMAGEAKKAQERFDAQMAAADAAQAVNDAVVGVADAQKAEAAAQDRVTEADAGRTQAQRALADARRGVAAAERQVTEARKGVDAAIRAEADAEKALSAARADVVTATEDLAKAERAAAGDSDEMRAALKGVATAQDNLTDAQQNTLEAQQALDQATQDYGQTLANLQDQAGGAADDVLSAEIRLRKAQAELANLGKDGKPVTADDRTQAEIAVREAERRVRAAQQAAAQAQADLDRNTANGAAGSDAVVAASEDVTTAKENEANAQAALQAAVQNVAGVQLAADAALADAHKTLTDKIDAVAAANQRVIDAKDAIAAAQLAVQNAVQGVADANRHVRDQQDAVAKANQAYIDAKQDVIDAHTAVGKAVDEVGKKQLDYAKAMKTVDEKTAGAEVAQLNFNKRLKDLIPTLAPGSPLRTYLEQYYNKLKDIYALDPAKPLTPGFGPLNGSGTATIGGLLSGSGSGTVRDSAGGAKGQAVAEKITAAIDDRVGAAVEDFARAAAASTKLKPSDPFPHKGKPGGGGGGWDHMDPAPVDPAAMAAAAAAAQATMDADMRAYALANPRPRVVLTAPPIRDPRRPADLKERDLVGAAAGGSSGLVVHYDHVTEPHEAARQTSAIWDWTKSTRGHGDD